MNNRKIQQTQSGFSLIEVAIVLVIVGILLGGVVGALGTRIENTRRSNTVEQLENIREAIIGFAMTEGRIPCPALATSDGLESGGGASACAEQHGFVPGRTLGIKGNYNLDSLLRDSWGNPIRYSVTTANSLIPPNALPDFTSTGEMKVVTISGLSPDLVICDTDTTADNDVTCTAGNTIVDNAPFIILSLGKDGGEYITTIKDDAADPPEQQENSGEAKATANATGENIEYLVGDDIVFVSKIFTNIEATYYDDLIVWESPYVLYSKMIEAGQLP